MYYNLRAQRLSWDTAQNNWQLVNVTERKIDSTHEIIKQLPQMNLNLNFKPKDLKEG